MGYKKRKLVIPVLIQNSDNKLKKTFIAGFYDGDGSCTNSITEKSKTRCVYISQSDKRILIDMNNYLKIFGINLYLRRKTRKDFFWYEIETKNSKDINNFYKEIPLRHPIKIRKLQDLIKITEEICSETSTCLASIS